MKWEMQEGFCPQCAEMITAAQFINGTHKCEKENKMTINTTKLSIKSCFPYAKGWQVNAIIDGVESEMTFYGESKAFALEQAKKRIELDGRLPHDPYISTVE